MKISIIDIVNINKEEFIQIFKTLNENCIESKMADVYYSRTSEYTRNIIINESGELIGYDRFFGSEWVLEKMVVMNEVIPGKDFLAKVKAEQRKRKIDKL